MVSPGIVADAESGKRPAPTLGYASEGRHCWRLWTCLPSGRGSSRPAPSTSLTRLPRAAKEIRVEATDRWGRVYTAVVPHTVVLALNGALSCETWVEWLVTRRP